MFISSHESDVVSEVRVICRLSPPRAPANSGAARVKTWCGHFINTRTWSGAWSDQQTPARSQSAAKPRQLTGPAPSQHLPPHTSRVPQYWHRWIHNILIKCFSLPNGFLNKCPPHYIVEQLSVKHSMTGHLVCTEILKISRQWRFL